MAFISQGFFFSDSVLKNGQWNGIDYFGSNTPNLEFIAAASIGLLSVPGGVRPPAHLGN